MRTNHRRWPSAVLACLFATAGLARAKDQPQWGERCSRNMVSEETGLPDAFDPETGTNVKWVVPLGTQSYSTPIVANGRIFLGTNNDRPRDPRHKGDRGVFLCLDEKDGSLLWQLVAPKRTEDPFLDWPRTGMCATATVEGDRVYLVTNRAEVACLDIDGLADGNDGPYLDEGRHMVPAGETSIEPAATDADIIWLFDMASGARTHQHDAAHGSILIDGPFLYTCTSNGVTNKHEQSRDPDAPSLIVVEKATGRYVARDREGMSPRTIHSTWSSPSLAEVGGKRLVFFGGGDGVCYAFEALREAPPPGEVATLKRVWRFDCDPSAPKEDIFRFQENRKEGASNITGMPVFAGGRVYVEAGGDVWHGKRQAWLCSIDTTKTGDITETGKVWAYPLRSHCMSTPAIRDGLAYIVDCAKTIHCVDVKTGQAVWTHDGGGEIWSSPLVADGKVYVGTRRGVLWILAAGRQKRVLASVDLGDAINPTPTAANGILYIATMRNLYAVAKS
ncbi:MAG: PQQ-binding-like beta-propeller repeat protein [Planctomycetes bacterium]|nr:PQQ-binding-like beta-propeller repeat protein [Planctomycetota bacterium]